MKKEKVLKIIAITLIVIGIGIFVLQKTLLKTPNYWGALGPDYSNSSIETVDNSMPKIENKDQILGNKDDLISFSIWPNTKVHSGIVSYRGSIKGGYFFEGNILINILDMNKNVLKKSNAMAKTNWMTADPVDFEGNIDFSGLPKGSAYFEIRNDNASGLPEYDKNILIPIIIE